MSNIGTNVEYAIDKEKKKLTITIDLTQDHGSSASGKTLVVASTKGNKEVEDTGVFIGVNAYRYPNPKPSRGN